MTKDNHVTYTEKQIGRHDDYHFELWKDSGDTTMTLKAGGAFTCSWSDVNNALFRKGRKYWQEQPYAEIGNISIAYGVDYRPEGNSYLCVYGWTRDPLVEYYIVESWGTWRPPGEEPRGQITVDGATYDVYVTTRENQPSIDGTATFQQYWSVRTSKSCSGRVSLNEHFKAWEAMGMPMGKLHEVSLTIEGYQSQGYADVYCNELTITPKQVALTFDDGPASTTTPQMLDILEAHHEVATFFLIGSNINEDTRKIMERQLAMGCELANHSFTHSHLNQLTAKEIQEEVEQTNAAIKAAVGVEPRFFRPPYIAVNELMHEVIHMPFIQGIMCDDWKPEVSPQERTRRILDRVQDGSIILIHDTEGNDNSVAALPDILAGLKQRGYQLVTLSQLFKSKGVDPEQKYHIWTHVKQ